MNGFLAAKIAFAGFVLMACTVTGHEIRWGFWAHKRINRLAVFRLPPPMLFFYKKHIEFITENAVNPDKRRYAVVGEAERHFLDLNVYGETKLPKYWREAVAQFGEDSLRKHGIVPWYIQNAAFQLTEAFRAQDAGRILRVSADLGHYIGDAHVPLHTTSNYNGQMTNQHGIHGLWESRLPELFAENYDFWLGQADYIPDVAEATWKAVQESHQACDSVLTFERKLSEDFKSERKYSFELRNNVLTNSYSQEFSGKYHGMLAGQVERRMRAAVQMTADMWYTCWVNAGQPDLKKLSAPKPADETEKDVQASWLRRLFPARTEPDD